MQISAVIPAYNAGKFVSRAIESVLHQSERVAEIIVVDDGSTDDTRDVVARFGDRVRYVCQENGGPSRARNHGLAIARGEWVAFLDADDWWNAEKIRRQRQMVEADPAVLLVYTGLQMVDDSGVIECRQARGADQLWPTLRWCNPIAPSSVLVRRRALQEIGGFDEKHRGTEDWQAWVRLWRMGRFACVAEPLTSYYVSPVGLSGNPSHMFRDFVQMLDSTLVADLSGYRRWIWRQRILSYQAFVAAMTARSSKARREERAFLMKSIAHWPSPFWQPKRYAAMAFYLKRRWLTHA